MSNTLQMSTAIKIVSKSVKTFSAKIKIEKVAKKVIIEITNNVLIIERELSIIGSASFFLLIKSAVIFTPFATLLKIFLACSISFLLTLNPFLAFRKLRPRIVTSLNSSILVSFILVG